jgi:hypothetical protein
VLASLIVSQRGPPRRYLTFAYGAWIVATLPFIGYAFGTAFALTGPVSKAIGIDATLVLAGVLPGVVCVVLYVAAGLRRDEDLHPLLGDAYAGAGASAADSGSGTPAIS